MRYLNGLKANTKYVTHHDIWTGQRDCVARPRSLARLAILAAARPAAGARAPGAGSRGQAPDHRAQGTLTGRAGETCERQENFTD